MRRTSLGRLPGRIATVGRSGDRCSAVEKLFTHAGGLDEIDERMPHKFHGHAGVAVDRLFERKDDKDAIDELLDGLEPAAAPRPDLRAHVVDDRHAELLHLARQPRVEPEKVDDHQRVHTRLARGGDQARHDSPEARELGDDVRETVDREALEVFEAFSAGLL